jgi:hypothetical protein
MNRPLRPVRQLPGDMNADDPFRIVARRQFALHQQFEIRRDRAVLRLRNPAQTIMSVRGKADGNSGSSVCGLWHTFSMHQSDADFNAAARGRSAQPAN